MNWLRISALPLRYATLRADVALLVSIFNDVFSCVCLKRRRHRKWPTQMTELRVWFHAQRVSFTWRDVWLIHIKCIILLTRWDCCWCCCCYIGDFRRRFDLFCCDDVTKPFSSLLQRFPRQCCTLHDIAERFQSCVAAPFPSGRHQQRRRTAGAAAAAAAFDAAVAKQRQSDASSNRRCLVQSSIWPVCVSSHAIEYKRQICAMDCASDMRRWCVRLLADVERNSSSCSNNESVSSTSEIVKRVRRFDRVLSNGLLKKKYSSQTIGVTHGSDLILKRTDESLKTAFVWFISRRFTYSAVSTATCMCVCIYMRNWHGLLRHSKTLREL